MSTIKSLFLTILVLSLAFTWCVAIKCYNCTSFQNMACNDPFQQKNHDLSHFLVDCEENATFCRKTISQVYLDSVNQTIRVTRTCGYLHDDKLALSKDDSPKNLKCYRKRGSMGADVEYCVCYSDRCNSGNIQFVENLVIFLTFVTSFIVTH